ncbi:hypothetical protein GCM10023331_05570 [Algivirga pacifica]|uniref:Uncharacterized protein n=2 Tax=Algivirga pacifica TaxID=1162670 RepID=A0ABP9D425_9BACT
MLAMLMLFAASSDVVLYAWTSTPVVEVEETQQSTQGEEESPEDEAVYKTLQTQACTHQALELDFVKINAVVAVNEFADVPVLGVIKKTLIHPTTLNYYQCLFRYYIATNAP